MSAVLDSAASPPGESSRPAAVILGATTNGVRPSFGPGVTSLEVVQSPSLTSRSYFQPSADRLNYHQAVGNSQPILHDKSSHPWHTTAPSTFANKAMKELSRSENDQSTSIAPHNKQISGRHAPSSHSRVAQRDISPPPTKRLRIDEPPKTDYVFKLVAPGTWSKQDVSNVQRSLSGSSDVPARKIFIANQSAPSSGKQQSPANLVPHRRHWPTPGVRGSPPTAPSSMVPRQGLPDQTMHSASRFLGDVPTEQRRQDIQYGLSETTAGTDRATSVSRTSTSEVSSTDPQAEKCINCKFSLRQNITIKCDTCSRKFHKTCAQKSKLVNGRWSCYRCLRVATRRAKIKDGGDNISRSEPPQVRPSSTIHDMGIDEPVSQPLRMTSENPGGRPSDSRNRNGSLPSLLDSPGDLTMMRAAGVRPSANAFANMQIHNKRTPIPITRNAILPSPSASVAENSMDIDNDANLTEHIHESSTPMPKSAHMEELDGLSASTLARESVVGHGRFSGSVPAPSKPSVISLPSQDCRLDDEQLKMPVKQVPNAEPVTGQRQEVNLSPINISNAARHESLTSLPTRTTDSASTRTNEAQVLNRPAQAKTKNRATLGNNVTSLESSLRPTQPNSIAAWAREFINAGCEDPFKDQASSSETLNFCDEIFETFGNYPWRLVDHRLWPKKPKPELLKSLASLKNVLHRFVNPKKCLENLETFVFERRVKVGKVYLTVGKMTASDVRAFVVAPPPKPTSTCEPRTVIELSDTETFSDSGFASAPQNDPTSSKTSALYPGADPHNRRDNTQQHGPTEQPTVVPSPITRLPQSVNPQRLVDHSPALASGVTARCNPVTRRGGPDISTNSSAHVGHAQTSPPQEYFFEISGFPRNIRNLLKKRVESRLKIEVDARSVVDPEEAKYLASLPLDNVVDRILKFASMEHLPTTATENQKPHVQELVSEFRKYRRQKYEVMIYSDPFDIADQNVGLLNLYAPWIGRAVYWVVEEFRERRNSAQTSAQHSSSVVDLTVKAPQTSAIIERERSIREGEHGARERRITERLHELPMRNDLESQPKDGFISVFWNALKEYLENFGNTNTIKIDVPYECIAVVMMTLVTKEHWSDELLKNEKEDVRTLIKLLRPHAKDRNEIMIEHSLYLIADKTKAALLDIYKPWIRPALDWALGLFYKADELQKKSRQQRQTIYNTLMAEVNRWTVVDKRLAANQHKARQEGSLPQNPPYFGSETVSTSAIPLIRRQVSSHGPRAPNEYQPEKAQRRIEKLIRTHYGTILNESNGQRPITAADVAVEYLSLATLENSCSPEQLAQLPKSTRKLIAESRALQAEKEAARVQMQNPATAESGKAAIERITRELTRKGIVCAAERVRAKQSGHAPNTDFQAVLAQVSEDGLRRATLRGDEEAAAIDLLSSFVMEPSPSLIGHESLEALNDAFGIDGVSAPESVPELDSGVGPAPAADVEVHDSRSNGSEIQTEQTESDLPSNLTELSQTPVSPVDISHLLKPTTSFRANRLRASRPENAAKSSELESDATAPAPTSSKPTRGLTQFTFRDLILLALYVDPTRLNGQDASLPKLSSKAIVEFIEEKFPVYKKPANSGQRHMLFHNIASQCSSHVARGLLKKVQDGKALTVYYVDVTSSKFPDPAQLAETSIKYEKHLSDFFGDALPRSDRASLSPTKKRSLDVPETPGPKKSKSTPPAASTETMQEQSVLQQPAARQGSRIAAQAARKTVSVSRPSLIEGDVERRTRTRVTAARMSASGSRSKRAANTSLWNDSSDQTLPDPFNEQDAREQSAPAVQAPERHQPQAYSTDPLEELFETSKKPSVEDQELLDMLSEVCNKEAARDVFKMDEQKFEVKDFFEHWPEYHPRNVLTINTERKIEEIRARKEHGKTSRDNKRAPESVFVYEPYADHRGLTRSAAPRPNQISSSSSISTRTASLQVSPRKRKVTHDESIIRVDDVDDSVFERDENSQVKAKVVRSWQEALGVPTKLELGWSQDLSVSQRERQLLFEAPAAQRGRSRNWFKAILP